MRFQFLVCLLLVTFVCAQTTAPPPAPTPASPPSGSSNAPTSPASPAPEPQVGPDDAVITIKGVCADSSLQGDACKTVITKAQFDKIVDTIQPGMAQPMRRQLAMRYIPALTMSMEAERRGLEKQPKFEESMKMARMQILAGELRSSLQTEANNVSDQEIQDYYDKNKQGFEQATLIKIFVPRTRREATPATPATKPGTKASTAASSSGAKPAAKKLTPEEEEKSNQEAMTKEAKILHERLVKGEDPDVLEKAAFTAAGILGTPPPTKMENVRRLGLQSDQQAVMDLNPGEVSEVISDPSGNFIYKMVSKETLPLDKVKTEIHNQLSAQHYRELMQKYQGTSELNDAYFGPARGPMMPPRGGPTRPGAPAKDNDPD
jgi:PPIC-type PPIASE domain